MANETLFASVSDQRTAAALSQVILLSLASRGALPTHPALIYGGDTAKSGTDTLNIPQVGLMGYDLLTAVADGATITNTAITDAVTALTPARHGKAYEVSDKALWTDPATGMLSVQNFAMDAVATYQASMLYALAQIGAGFSASVGTSTQDMAVADHLAGRIALEIANVAGPYMAVYHSRQEGDLTVSAATATGGAIQWRSETQTLLGNPGSGGKGSYLAVDVFVTNHIPTANAGADRNGFMFGRGAIVWGILSPTAQTSDQVALGPVLFEQVRSGRDGATAYVTNAYLDFAEAIDLAGVGVITDA